MRVFFIVQGEGRGHLTQALTTEALLRSAGHEVAEVLVGKSNARELSVNLSLYNVYAHKNVQFILASGKFMKQVSMLPYPIPSLSVSFRF